MVRFYTYLEVYLDDLTKQVSLSEFEGHFGIPHQTIKKRLEPFTNAKILTQEKKERFLFYKLNMENRLTMEYLTLCEKERLFRFLEQAVIFSQLYKELSQFFKDAKILIFGSATEKKDFSDVDLLIISNDKRIKPVITKFSQTYSVKIHMIQTTERNLTKTFLNEIRKKHIILNNHDYFREVLYR